MLDVHKTKMLKTFSDMLNKETPTTSGGVIYEAAKEAYYVVNKCPDNIDFARDDSENAMENNAMIEAKLEQSRKEQNERAKENAKKFAEKFVDILKYGGFDTTIANEIDDHVKALDLIINVLPTGITVTSPTGPCTGTILINNSTANIQLL